MQVSENKGRTSPQIDTLLPRKKTLRHELSVAVRMSNGGVANRVLRLVNYGKHCLPDLQSQNARARVARVFPAKPSHERTRQFAVPPVPWPQHLASISDKNGAILQPARRRSPARAGGARPRPSALPAPCRSYRANKLLFSRDAASSGRCGKIRTTRRCSSARWARPPSARSRKFLF